MNGAELIVDYSAGSCRSRLYIESAARQRLGDSFGGGVVVIECNRAVSIGQEIDSIADPHRIEVIGILARQLFDARVGQPRDPNRGCSAASVVLPDIKCGCQR